MDFGVGHPSTAFGLDASRIFSELLGSPGFTELSVVIKCKGLATAELSESR